MKTVGWKFLVVLSTPSVLYSANRTVWPGWVRAVIRGAEDVDLRVGPWYAELRRLTGSSGVKDMEATPIPQDCGPRGVPSSHFG